MITDYEIHSEVLFNNFIVDTSMELDQMTELLDVIGMLVLLKEDNMDVEKPVDR